MITRREIEEKVKEIEANKRNLTVDEFAEKADLFFAEVTITSKIVEELITNGYLPFHEEKEIVPTNKLLEFNPHSLLSIEEFASRTGLTKEKAEELITEGKIKTLDFLAEPRIHIEEFRNHAEENNIETIHKQEELYKMLDDYFRSSSWWDDFYKEREKPVPFFVKVPDENLVSYFKQEMIKPKKALVLGCGNGRNAVYLAEQGCQVDAVDSSPEAISWGRENAQEAGVEVNFICQSIFDLTIDEKYDLVYDSGCFHHIPPHRRFSYLALLDKALKSGKYFGLTCFNGKRGAGFTDWEVYEKRSLGGGLAYSKQEIERIFTDLFEIIEFREMKEIEVGQKLFGESFMWSILFKKK